MMMIMVMMSLVKILIAIETFVLLTIMWRLLTIGVTFVTNLVTVIRTLWMFVITKSTI